MLQNHSGMTILINRVYALNMNTLALFKPKIQNPLFRRLYLLDINLLERFKVKISKYRCDLDQTQFVTAQVVGAIFINQNMFTFQFVKFFFLLWLSSTQADRYQNM